jgi:hypothetical protein
MANHFVCGDRMQTALLKSLFNKDSNIATTINQYGFRIVEKTKDASANTLVCNSMQDFWNMLAQCIEIGTDNKPVLRVINTTKQSGSGLTDVPNCGTSEELDLIMLKCFCTDTNGDICFQLFNIT